jgi:hypothetical protein
VLAAEPAGSADVGLPAGGVEECNFTILQKPYRREQLAMHISAALGEPVIVDV